MADILLVVVRYAHILSAILWIGSLGFSVMVLRSALSSVEANARKDTLRKLIPLSNRFIPRTAVLTIVFGTLLYLLMGSFEPAILLGTNWGLVVFAALVLSVGLLVFGVTVVRHTSEVILGHLNEDACAHGPEMPKLQQMLNRGQVVALVWGFIILGLMVAATGAL